MCSSPIPEGRNIQLHPHCPDGRASRSEIQPVKSGCLPQQIRRRGRSGRYMQRALLPPPLPCTTNTTQAYPIHSPVSPGSNRLSLLHSCPPVPPSPLPRRSSLSCSNPPDTPRHTCSLSFLRSDGISWSVPEQYRRQSFAINGAPADNGLTPCAPTFCCRSRGAPLFIGSAACGLPALPYPAGDKSSRPTMRSARRSGQCRRRRQDRRPPPQASLRT